MRSRSPNRSIQAMRDQGNRSRTIQALFSTQNPWRTAQLESAPPSPTARPSGPPCPVSGPAHPPHPAKPVASSPVQRTAAAPARGIGPERSGSRLEPTATSPKGTGGRHPPHPARWRGPTPAAPSVLPTATTGRSPAQRTALEAGTPEPYAFQTSTDFEAQLGRQSGQRLPPTVLRRMERLFNADLSQVRVHIGPQAPAIGALAFTLGTDIYFAPGEYAPHTRRGQHVLAHELTHVIQQQDGRVQSPFEDGVAVVQDPALEAEAEEMGRKATAQPLLGTTTAPAHPAVRGAGGQHGASGTRPPHAALRVRREDRPSAQRHTALRSVPPGPGTGGGQAGDEGYQITIGTYLHENEAWERLPEELAGHTFVSIASPRGDRQTFGFSPAHFSQYDPRTDFSRLRVGVEGRVHDDSDALGRADVHTRTYAVGPDQARNALARVDEYQRRHYQFSLDRRQCSAFALDVLDAADIHDLGTPKARRPRELYNILKSTGSI